MNLNLFDDTVDPGRLTLHERENCVQSASEAEFENRTPFPEHTPLAMAYVPFQQWGDVYPAEDAMDCGTLFPDLVFPFRGGAKND